MAERALATAFVNVVPGTADFEKVLKSQLTGTMPNLGDEAGGRFSGGFGGALKGIGGVLTASLGVGAVVGFTKSLISAAEAEVQGNARLENITKSMGLFGTEAGTVAKRLEDVATKQQLANGIDDDTIKLTQSKLLTFKELAKTADTTGGAFDRATQAALDLAAAGFGTAESNAVQLGKALQDPEKGLTALARSGVTFTEVEKARIKTLVESNQMGAAQALILSAIETQVGGTAAATATGSERMKQGFENLKETLGLALLPAFNGFTTYVSDVALPAATAFFEAFKAGKTPLNDVFNSMGQLLNFVRDNWTWISTLTTAIVAGIAAFKAYEGILIAVKTAKLAWITVTTAMTVVSGLMRGATISATLAQLGLNAALVANPIGIVIAAVAALVAGLVYFFTQTEVGKKAWAAFTAFLSTSVKAVGDFFKTTFEAIGGWVSSAFDGAMSKIRGFINTVIDMVNSVVNVINGLGGAISALTGNTININIKKIPKLAKGGLVTTPTTAMIGEAGPEMVIPLKDFQQMTGTGDGASKVINYYAAPNQSLDAQQALFTAMKRGKVIAGW